MDLRIGVELDYAEWRHALGAGEGLIYPEVAKVNLPEIHVLPDSAKRAEGHGSFEASAATCALHVARLMKQGGNSSCDISWASLAVGDEEGVRELFRLWIGFASDALDVVEGALE